MNDRYRELLPLSQQIKLRRLELDIEALEKILKTEKTITSAEAANQRINQLNIQET